MKLNALNVPLFASAALCMTMPYLSDPSVLASMCAGLSMSSHRAVVAPSAPTSNAQTTPTPVFSTLSAAPSRAPSGNGSLATITHTLTLTLTAGADPQTYQSAASSSPAPTHIVEVGPRGAFVFDPPEVAAARGDIIRFLFVSENHTVTQSTLEQPCVPNGFDTGFVNVDERGPRHVDYVVNSDQAWFHCRQGDHCERGMLFAVNPGSSLPEFSANAGYAI